MSVKLTIIGAGPGGYVAAIHAARKGAQVTVVESEEVGGTCLHRGCIPTKTLIASAEALRTVHHAAEFGITVAGTPAIDLGRIRARRDAVVALQVKGIRGLLKSWGVNLIAGHGSLFGPDEVRVTQQDGTTLKIKSERVILATGSRPTRLPGFPFDGKRVITSDEAVRLDRIPASILIVGAGVIGSEFAFLYRSFGSEVTVAELMPRALATEDESVSEFIAREFKKHKIKLLTNVGVEGVRASEGGLLTATLSKGREVAAEMILVSIGRSMNIDGLGLESAGVATGRRGEITVNERMETSAPGIYAIGDVTGTVMLAHVASRQGLVAVENALGGTATMDYAAVPSGIFTMPEIGSVGLREHQAAAQGMRYRVGTFPLRSLGKAHAMGEIAGMVKIIAEEETDRVVGMHICGAHATDLIHEGALAVTQGITARQLGGVIHAHPTLAEAIMEAAEDVHGNAVHLPKPGK